MLNNFISISMKIEDNNHLKLAVLFLHFIDLWILELNHKNWRNSSYRLTPMFKVQ